MSGICDGFTYFDGKADKRSYMVLLENKENKEQKVHPSFKLKKQVSPLRYPGEEKVRFWIYLLHICQKKRKLL